MKKILEVSFALILSAVSQTTSATTFFADYFTNNSTLNSASPANPTTTNTAYELVSSKAWNPTPSLGVNDLKFGIAATTSGYIQAQALFATNAIALTQPGDFIQLTVVFTNTSGLLTVAGQLGCGLYNSSQVKPIAGGINNTIASTYSGGAQNWLGYVGVVNQGSAASRILTRPAQSATTGLNQDLVTFGTSSSYAGNAVVGTAVAANLTLTVGAAYTEVFTITLNDVNSLAITNILYSGPNTSGTVVTNFGGIATNTTFLTSGFDGLAVGYTGRANSGGNPLIDISSIQVSGSVTTISGPPDITSQPAAVTVPIGGSCDFFVTAQGFNMTYQWHRFGTNLLNGGNISGATSDTLIISPASPADAASGPNGYYVTITGAGGYSTNSTTNSLSLVAAKDLIWSGSGVNWDLGVSPNWTANGTPGAYFNFGDNVTFDNSGLGALAVTLTGNYLSAASVTVNSDSGYDYVFSGTGSFAGPGQLSYLGAGHLTINNANTFSGGTIINNANAYLVLGNYNGLGAGPVTLQSGQMEITKSGSATAGINGDLNVADDFNIQLDGVGTFATVFLGNLSGTAGKTLSLTPKNLTTTNRFRVYGTNTVYNANLVLNGPFTSQANYAGTTLAPYQPGGSQTYNGVISGNGGIIQRGNGTTILNGANTYSGGTTPTAGAIGFGSDDDGTTGAIGSGALLLNPEIPNLTGSGLVFASGGARTIANPVQYPSGTNNQTLVIGGTNNLTFSGPYQLDGLDGLGGPTNRTIQVTNLALTTISGVISDGGFGFGLIKTGNGVLVLANTETYTGPTAVSNGTLRVIGQIGNSAVTVVTNATLGGTGSILGPVTVLTGGILAPGNSIGALTVNNDLTLAGNLSIEVNTSAGTTSDKIVVSGALTNSGAGSVSVTNLGPTLVAGNSFTLFNKPLTNGAALTVTGAGVNWTNKLAIDGTIAVLAAIPTTPTNISFSVAGQSLTLRWPSTYLGWTLETNSVSILATNWARVPASSGVTQMTITLDPAKTNVFYRLVYP